ncbi:efflux RND transporter periplasmic adaptor subunit [Spongiibacter sp. KMU-158]|uniref:Efflux RND transporter periplasmic adaptor subunit n=1 Tax=Spongiibacter pelagi TaxID=2760804 RepID=A0A927BYC6_9GAMM|nr:efflux RND transporter periplasmic adaptor subunit [Spongiibacter pelagi]MBD2857819.1 efflux RND transporter periplasmic adaptor subunit [Spongiibacter pelagi]
MLNLSPSQRLLATALLTIGLSACEQKLNASAATIPSTPVKIITAEEAPIVSSMEALGTLKALNATTITSSVSEKITALHFQDGQQVKKGDLIATLEQEEEQAQLLAAKAELAEHQREIDRLGKLLQTQAAARTEYDSRLSQRDQAKARIAEVQAKIDERTLRAPFSGHIGLRLVSPGALLSPGTTITTLDQLDILQLDFQLPSRAIPAVQLEQSITATSTSRDETIAGKISAIDSRVDPVSRSLTVRALVNNADLQLKPGMLMKVEILESEHPGFSLPEQTLLNDQDRSYVWLVDEQGKAQQRTVSLGRRHDGLVEIRKGISAGDRVIVEGFLMLRPGAPVSVLSQASGS